jgi:hypothetical protein
MEFVPEGTTVNKHCDKEILCHLHSSIQQKRPELWRRKNWLLLNDNTPARTHHFVLVREELAKQQVAILPHPPTHIISPCDFFFFPSLKQKVRRRPFQSAEEIMTVTREGRGDFPANIFQQCFQQLYQRWQTCIPAKGDYFEGGCGYV